MDSPFDLLTRLADTNPDLVREVAAGLPHQEVINVCRGNKTLNRVICSSGNYYRLRLLREYPNEKIIPPKNAKTVWWRRKYLSLSDVDRRLVDYNSKYQKSMEWSDAYIAEDAKNIRKSRQIKSFSSLRGTALLAIAQDDVEVLKLLLTTYTPKDYDFDIETYGDLIKKALDSKSSKVLDYLLANPRMKRVPVLYYVNENNCTAAISSILDRHGFISTEAQRFYVYTACPLKRKISKSMTKKRG